MKISQYLLSLSLLFAASAIAMDAGEMHEQRSSKDEENSRNSHSNDNYTPPALDPLSNPTNEGGLNSSNAPLKPKPIEPAKEQSTRAHVTSTETHEGNGITLQTNLVARLTKSPQGITATEIKSLITQEPDTVIAALFSDPEYFEKLSPETQSAVRSDLSPKALEAFTNKSKDPIKTLTQIAQGLLHYQGIWADKELSGDQVHALLTGLATKSFDTYLTNAKNLEKLTPTELEALSDTLLESAIRGYTWFNNPKIEKALTLVNDYRKQNLTPLIRENVEFLRGSLESILKVQG